MPRLVDPSWERVKPLSHFQPRLKKLKIWKKKRKNACLGRLAVLLFSLRIREPLKSGCFEDPQTPLRDTGSYKPLQGPRLGLLIFLVQNTKLNYDLWLSYTHTSGETEITVLTNISKKEIIHPVFFQNTKLVTGICHYRYTSYTAQSC